MKHIYERSHKSTKFTALFIIALFTLQLAACAFAPPTEIAVTLPTATEIIVVATLTPTNMPAHPPIATATSTFTPKPTITATPAPTETFTPEPTTSITIASPLKEKWESLGFIADYRENGQQLTTTQTTLNNYDKFIEYFTMHPNEFDAIYGPERRNQLLNPEAGQREGLSWRVGFTQFTIDKEYVNLDAEFGLGGIKKAGEVPMPDTEIEGVFETLEQIGASVHAINLGILDRDNYDPNWYPKYLKYIKKNPNATYELKGSVQKPGEPGKFEVISLGTVNATFPVEIVVLPPVMEKNTAMERVDRIIGADPRAPFGMKYLDRDGGYFDIKITPEGKLIIYLSSFIVDKQLMSSKQTSIVSDLSDMLSAARGSSYLSALTSGYGTPKSLIEIYHLLYKDPFKGGWQQPLVTWQ